MSETAEFDWITAEKLVTEPEIFLPDTIPDTEPQQPVGISISDKVNQQDVAQLNSMGFSKNVAEKALFLTQNKGVEAAMAWIDKNMDEPDYEEPLMIVG